MSLTFDERQAIVEYRMEKALRLFDQAKGIAPLQYWETVANRM